MRADFGSHQKQIKFFRNAKPINLSIRNFFIRVNSLSNKSFTFSAFRHWYQGKSLPLIEAVESICKFTNIDISNLDITKKSENWGCVIGGKRKYKLYGLKINQRQLIKGGQNGMLALRRKFSKSEWKKVSHIAALMGAKSKTGFRRKVIGPKGEKMFNSLEKEVAEILLKLNVDYEYEKILKIKNNYIIPDFLILANILIECTYWSFVKDKSRILKKHFREISKNTSIDKIVVITSNRLRDNYRQKLGQKITTLTSKELPEWLTTQS
jgi:hypothetical protein